MCRPAVTSVVDWTLNIHRLSTCLFQSKPMSLWTLLRSGDTTQLSYVTSLGTPTPPLSRHRLLPNLSQGLSGRTLRVVVKEVSGR